MYPIARSTMTFLIYIYYIDSVYYTKMYLLEWKVLSYQTKVNLLDLEYGPFLYFYEVFYCPK